MRLMKAFRAKAWSRPMRIPTIIVQPPGRRYNPPENPPGYLQIMQAINITNDLVRLVSEPLQIAPPIL